MRGRPCAKTGPIDDWLLDAEHLAECPHVVTPLGQVPSGGIIPAAAAVAAMIEVDDLGDVGQCREGWSVERMGPPWRRIRVGFSLMRGPSGTRPALSTSKKSLTPLTWTNIQTPYPHPSSAFGLAAITGACALSLAHLPSCSMTKVRRTAIGCLNMREKSVPVLTLAINFIGVMTAFSAYAQSAQCIGQCLVEVVGLQSTYRVGDQVVFSVQNTSERELNVNVIIEGMLSASWRESMSTLTDLRDTRSKARSPKVVPLMPIKAGASLVLVFDPCKMTSYDWPFSKNWCGTPETGVPDPVSWRVRVDVVADGTNAQGVRQEVRSRSFDFVAVPKNH